MDDASVFLLSTSESEGGKDCADEKIKDEFPFTEEEGPVNILSPHRSTFCAMSMDEVLFGDSKNRHVAALLESPARCIAKHSSCSSSYSSSLSSSPSRSVCNDNVAMREGDEAVPDVPRSMLELRGMTCADVRGVLEPFFRRKEEARRQFDAARERLAAMMATTTTTTITAGSVSKVNKKMLDRWRRLVNISNWGDGTSSSNNNNNDVLFPDVLVPPVTSLLGGSNTPTTASSNTMLVPSSELRYLRPHQLDGIRFLWSILVEGPCGKVPAVGCILAHTMGLGKTCQVVVFLHLFLGDQRRRGRGRGRPQRVLIAVPKSMRSGWCKEFSTWSQYFPLADRITPIVIDERDNARRRAEVYREWRKAGGVLLLGYEMLLGLTRVSDMENKRDNKEESSTEWIDLLICDEAHRLKSTHLQISTALRGLHPLRRLLLTGTPLQNHLQEYWAMVDFAVHKYFEKKRFQEFFINPIEASVAKEASSKEVAAARMKTFALIRELRHFVQRVDSTPLQKELPPLHEYVVVVPLSALQTRLYNRFLCLLRREHSKFNFLQAVSYANKISSHPQLLFDTDPTSPVRGILNNVDSEWDETTTTTTNNNNNNNNSVVDEEEEEQMQKTNREKTARQQQRTKSSTTVNGVYAELCQTPAGYTATPEDGAKLYISIKIIKAAMLRGEKVLFFSLSTKLLDLFEGIIAEMNRRWKQDGSLPRSIRFCRLDGSNTSAEREDTLRSFKGNKGADVLLLSMKAGGVGITITSATRVILADSGFNPADDRQAIGRAYRYGQTRPVFVYRLVCYQTLEHRMFQQKVAKEWLFRTIVEEASLKRDALSGLRLQSMFQLLGRARKVSSGVLPTLTDEQQNSTARLVAEDTVLADVAEDILYAESHAVYLQHDEFVQYGNEEKLFYEEYQKKGIFNVDKNIDTSAADMERWKRRREKHQENVEEQTKTLTALVDDIIRSRADDDPKLRHLLRMMGVIVDASGVVSVAASSAQEAEKEAKELHSVVVDDDYESDDDDDERHSRLHGEKAPRTEAWPALRPVKIDDDDDESILFDKAKSDGGSLVLVDPSKYEPYRPGRDSHCAILIDEDDDL